MTTPNPDILDSVLNNNNVPRTKTPTRTTLEMLKIPKKPLKKQKIKIRPMRVKIRKPVQMFKPKINRDNKKSNKKKRPVESSFNMDDLMDNAFGMKQPVTNEDLVRNPTSGINSQFDIQPTPGPQSQFEINPTSKTHSQFDMFDDFLKPAPTTPKPVILLENVKTADLQKEDMSEPNYD